MAFVTLTLREVIDLTGGHIGLDDYPIFDEEYRDQLNQKIIDHYMNREIGHETIDMFVFAVRRKMNEIMPFYNQLYTTAPIADPYQTINVESSSKVDSRSHNKNVVTAESNNTTTAKSEALGYTYPQTRITEDGKYANEGSESATTSGADTTSRSSDDGVSDGTTDTSNTTKGFQGVALSDLLIRYRETFRNIDMELIGELSELFMMIWNNSDTYTQEGLWP